jgi:hypothetical protein
MSLPRKTTSTRLIAIALCLFAFSIYISFGPTGSYAGSCTCGGGMNNACDNGAQCVCMSYNGVCSGCEWVQNSANCKKPCLVGFEEGGY